MSSNSNSNKKVLHNNTTSTSTTSNNNTYYETIENDYKTKLSTLEHQANQLLDPALQQLTDGLPKWELNLILKEAEECEKALLNEISMLEQSISTTSTQLDGKSSGDTNDITPSVVSSTTKKNNSTTTTTSEDNDDDNSIAKEQIKAMITLREQNLNPLPFQYGLGNPSKDVNEILSNEYTTVDKFLTLSSLLGRLFWTTSLPKYHPLSISIEKDIKTKKEKDIKKHFHQQIQERTLSIQRQERLIKLIQHTNYNVPLATTEEISTMLHLPSNNHPTSSDLSSSSKKHASSSSTNNAPTLLSLWKKINQHKTATVFRKPVSDKDAPGYSERILFPMDLSLIKKMITSGTIVSIKEFHHKIILICHNCMKFNGSISDYGIIARDFEKYTEDTLYNAIDSVVPSTLYQPPQVSLKGKSEMDGGPTAAATTTTMFETSSKKHSASVNEHSKASSKNASHGTSTAGTSTGVTIKKHSSNNNQNAAASYNHHHHHHPEPVVSSSTTSSSSGGATLTFTIGQQHPSNTTTNATTSPSNSSNLSRGRGRPSKKRK